jgi:hypothetical protein
MRAVRGNRLAGHLARRSSALTVAGLVRVDSDSQTAGGRRLRAVASQAC